MAEPGFHALLIGVAHYLSNDLGGVTYPSLEGCVRDVEAMADELLRLGIAPRRIRKLTSSPNPDSPEDEPEEPPELWPSYDQIVAAWTALEETAAAGDQRRLPRSRRTMRQPWNRNGSPEVILRQAMKCSEKLAPAMSMKTIATRSTASLRK